MKRKTLAHESRTEMIKGRFGHSPALKAYVGHLLETIGSHQPARSVGQEAGLAQTFVTVHPQGILGALLSQDTLQRGEF